MKKSDYWKYCLIIVPLFLVTIQIQAQNGWTQKADIPNGGGSASVVNDKIYVLGGTTAGSLIDQAYNMVYDPSTNIWVEKAPMPTARGFLTSEVVRDTIYAIGGGYPTAKKKVEAYDPITNSWITKADMLSPRLGMRAGVVNGIIYTIGGNYNQRNCQAYDPGTNIWTEKTPVPVGGGGALSVTVYNGLIYTFGGSTYTPWGALSTVYAYNPQADTWTQKQNMPTPRFAFQTYLVGGKIYAIGGTQSDNGVSLATVEVYDPVTDTWETKPDMPFGMAWFSGTVVYNKIYIISGTQNWGTTISHAVWEYDPAYVVPVELTSFTAEALDQKVVLKWTTATELNNNGFEVQRKVAENDFATIGFVRGEGTTTNQKEYSYIDKDLVDAKYFYRLKQVDYNGSYEYSNVIEVDVRSLNEYALEQNYPNPFNPTTTIGYVLREKATANLMLLNAIGEEVAVLVNEDQDKGFHKVDFNAANLPSGVYFYRLQAGSFVQTRKMILIR